MGEIGITLADFKRLRWWEIRSIIRGYNRRHRDLWSSTRWQTYNLMQAFCGGKALNDAGIRKPTDLIKFPWDSAPVATITEDEALELQAEIDAINAANAGKPSQNF